MRKILLGGAALALTAAMIAPGATAGAAPEPTLADILLSDSSGDDADGFDFRPYDFDIVTQAVLLFPDLTAAASDPTADITAFLPEDLAFRKLVRELTGEWINSEAEVFAVVASLGADTVKDILSYHITPGTLALGDVLKSDGAVLDTLLAGSTLTVDVRGIPVIDVQIIDEDGASRNSTVVRANLGGPASNGRAHGIDRVLIP